MTSVQNSELNMRTVEKKNQGSTKTTTSPSSHCASATPRKPLRRESEESHREDSEENSDLSDSDLSTPKQKKRLGHNDNIFCIPEGGASKSSKYVFGLVIGVLSLFIAYYLFPGNEDVHATNGGVQTERLRDKIRRLKNKFPKQETDTWYALMSGIKKVVEDNPNEPSVFLLLHNVNDYTSDCLARKVSEAAMEFFNSSSNGSPVELQGKDLKTYEELNADYGWLIDKYSQILKEQHVMIVYDLQNIPAHLAQTFHAFCDPHSPLVDRAVILFTLETTDAAGLEGNPTKLAESTLTKLWGENLEKEIFHPLLVRLTNDVHFVNPENLMFC